MKDNRAVHADRSLEALAAELTAAAYAVALQHRARETWLETSETNSRVVGMPSPSA